MSKKKVKKENGKIIINIKNSNSADESKKKRNSKSKKKHSKRMSKGSMYQNPVYNPTATPFYSGGGGSIPMSSAKIPDTQTNSTGIPTRTNKPEYSTTSIVNPPAATPAKTQQLTLTNAPEPVPQSTNLPLRKPRAKRPVTNSKLDYVSKDGIYQMLKEKGVPVRKSDSITKMYERLDAFTKAQQEPQEVSHPKKKSPKKPSQPIIEEPDSSEDDDVIVRSKPDPFYSSSDDDIPPNVTVRKRRDSIQDPNQADMIDWGNSQNPNDNASNGFEADEESKPVESPVKRFIRDAHRSFRERTGIPIRSVQKIIPNN
jgi:hypothetical protein